MASKKPTHLRPLTDEEREQLRSSIDPISGRPISTRWWGGVRWQRNKKYGQGRHHKGRDANGNMIRDTGRS